MKNFVICHSTEERENIINNHYLNGLESINWVMVGSQDFSTIENDPTVIIERYLQYNIDYLKNLCAFTAWYALVSNGFIEDNEYYGMFEYDIIVAPYFSEKVKENIKPNSILGFIPFPIDHPLFGDGGTTLLRTSIWNTYGMNIDTIISAEVEKKRRLWCSTTNCVILGRYIKDFVLWFMPLIPEFEDNPQMGHVPERALRIWMAINNIKPLCIINILKHIQRKSHGIEANLI